MLKLKEKIAANQAKVVGAIVASPLAMKVIGLTSDGSWVVTFDDADKAAIGQGFTNALTNLWNWFTVILPYLGMAIGVVLVLGLAFRLIFKRG